MNATVKLNRFDPMRWLAEALESLPRYANGDFDALLPFAKSGSQQSAAVNCCAGCIPSIVQNMT
ncbi:MAG: transposase domain-containing protein [Burkholderiaceae bacterium]